MRLRISAFWGVIWQCKLPCKRLASEQQFYCAQGIFLPESKKAAMPTETIAYINPKNTCLAQGLYSHATEVPSGGKTLYIAGQLSVGLDGSVVGKGDFSAQMRQVLDNLGAVLKGTGPTYNNIIKFTTYLVHSQDIESFMKIRAEMFPKLFGGTVFPPNTLLMVDRLVKEEFLIEIEAIAYADPAGAMRQP